MSRKKSAKAVTSAKPDGFINVAVTRETRAGLHYLKEAMAVQGQAEVIEKLVGVGIAIYSARR